MFYVDGTTPLDTEFRVVLECPYLIDTRRAHEIAAGNFIGVDAVISAFRMEGRGGGMSDEGGSRGTSIQFKVK